MTPTQGPWRVVNGVQIRSLRDQVAKVWMMRGGEGKANAALIAAAPDLLAALQALLADTYLSDPINNDRMALARAAVASATGGTP